MNIQEKKTLFSVAIITNIIKYRWQELDDKELNHLINSIDYSRIPDRLIANEECVRKHINWNKVNRLQLVRLIAQDPDILDLVDVSKYSYTLREIHFVLKKDSSLIDRFNIKLDAVDKNEVKAIVCMGYSDLIDKFNLSEYPFKGNELFDMIKKHNYSRKILESVDLSKLETYHLKDIMAYGDDSIIDLIDLSKLTSNNWLEILKNKPYLFNMCDLEKFMTCDIFTTIKLVIMFKSQKIDYLLDRRGYEKISAFGWEKLIIADPDTYLHKCDLNKLNQRHWTNIVQFHPNLANYAI